ncbi:hypothetical protein HUT19_15495 [Streptomyces sp. NA02950]|uniref:hypothetical protein n=1 Tax=Streptomyces sp. NA02950 TaxID=2742137 RepID=UPI00159209A0|nr:hypothetical protein [Streptomyces sp. NA02950]QKV92987.1 hypothetical protein HUT19_15495 [Streptomyces sp. NA02950]
MTGVGGEDPTRYERELRELLERAVPRPGPPADRLGQVRQRVLRQRRRRAAGLAGGAVAALMVINVVAPARDGGGGGGGAAHRPDTAPRSAATGSFRFPALAGMTVRLPDGWSGRAVPARPGRDPVGLAGSRPTTVSSASSSASVSCPDVQRYCLGRSALRAGEGLIVFRLQRGHVGEGGGAGALLMATGLGKSCRAAGGTRELTGWRAVEEGAGRAGDELVVASACLHRPSATALGQVRSVLRTAVFPGARATGA